MNFIVALVTLKLFYVIGFTWIKLYSIQIALKYTKGYLVIVDNNDV